MYRSSLVSRASVQLSEHWYSAVLAALLVPQGVIEVGDDVCNLLDGSEHDFHALLYDLQEQPLAYMVPKYMILVNYILRITSRKVNQHTLATILEYTRLDRHQPRDVDENKKDLELSESYKKIRDLQVKVLGIPPSSIFVIDICT